MSDRTFKIDAPLMQGTDIEAWQSFLYTDFRDRWNIAYPLGIDGNYGPATRSATASFMRAWGVESAADAMDDGLTPEWRVKLRTNDRTADEVALSLSDERKDYRAALRDRYDHVNVASPLNRILDDSWGYHPPVHDGVDLICAASAPIFAICTGKVVRVSAGGWWGKGAPADPVLRAKGDGIIILESSVDDGPFAEGLHFGYGHAEGAVVREGQRVKAGDHLGHAGFANAWHVHFMVNNDPPQSGFYRGVGDRDPMPFVNYATRV